MFEIVEKASGGTNIKVIGVGGAGGNAVDHMIREGVQGVDFITANTDAQALSRCLSPVKVQLGKTGLGAGSKPEAGRAAAQESRDAIAAALEGAHMCFITAGMGGGTGTGAAPVVAEMLGYSDQVTQRHADLASEPWGRYASAPRPSST